MLNLIVILQQCMTTNVADPGWTELPSKHFLWCNLEWPCHGKKKSTFTFSFELWSIQTYSCSPFLVPQHTHICQMNLHIQMKRRKCSELPWWLTEKAMQYANNWSLNTNIIYCHDLCCMFVDNIDKINTRIYKWFSCPACPFMTCFEKWIFISKWRDKMWLFISLLTRKGRLK